MTEQQKPEPKSQEEFLRSYSHCLNKHCTSIDVTITERSEDCDYITVGVKCEVCGTTWKEVYQLACWEDFNV